MVKDILTIVMSPAEEGAFCAAEYLAKRWNAHSSILYLARQPEGIIGDPAYTATLWAAVAEAAGDASAREFEQVKSRVDRMEGLNEVRRESVFLGTIEEVATRQAMYADITILQAPDNVHKDAAFEAALFRSGRPVLVVPPTWREGSIGKRIVVAWKPKREAARAVADASSFLDEAEQVTVITVDAQAEEGGRAAGRDIAANLARKGVAVELRNVDGMGEPAETALLNEASALEADLIVMGAYGHSRLREFVFGGVTRALSRKSPIPVLLSH